MSHCKTMYRLAVAALAASALAAPAANAMTAPGSQVPRWTCTPAPWCRPPPSRSTGPRTCGTSRRRRRCRVPDAERAARVPDTEGALRVPGPALARRGGPHARAEAGARPRGDADVAVASGADRAARRPGGAADRRRRRRRGLDAAGDRARGLPDGRRRPGRRAHAPALRVAPRSTNAPPPAGRWSRAQVRTQSGRVMVTWSGARGRGRCGAAGRTACPSCGSAPSRAARTSRG